MLKEIIKTTSTHPPHRYSAEQVISSLMKDSSSELDSNDSDTNSEKSEKIMSHHHVQMFSITNHLLLKHPMTKSTPSLNQ